MRRGGCREEAGREERRVCVGTHVCSARDGGGGARDPGKRLIELLEDAEDASEDVRAFMQE